MNTKYQKSLRVLDQTVEKQITSDMHVLARENDSLMKELNELAYKNKMMMRAIERIPQNLVKDQKGLTKEERLEKEFDEIRMDNQRLKEKLEELIVIKDRMSHIIEICEINSHQNEKWIIVGFNNHRD